MTEIFLGNPPEHIRQWIIAHSEPIKPKMTPLCFTAETDGSEVSLVFTDYGIPDDNPPVLQYSMNDTEHWLDYEINQIVPLNKDQKVYFQAKTKNVRFSAPPLNGPPMIYTFTMTGKIAASGNVNTLLNPDPNADVSLEGKDWCYNQLFQNCTSLTQAPELPATTLAKSCYEYMFNGCSSLTQAPVLPATTLAKSCYEYMFQNCTALTQAQELPATTLADRCYAYMFFNCSSLTKAPELPATTLADQCYTFVFGDCSQFSEVHMKSSMKGVYNTSTHGDTTKTVVYDL